MISQRKCGKRDSNSEEVAQWHHIKENPTLMCYLQHLKKITQSVFILRSEAVLLHCAQEACKLLRVLINTYALYINKDTGKGAKIPYGSLQHVYTMRP